MKETIISFNNLVKTYSTGKEIIIKALDKITAEISEGEFVAIMGASGSGKSTLMNIIGCLDIPSEGEYFLENRKINNLNNDQLAKIRNSKIGFVFQNFNLLSRISAVENVELPLLYDSSIKSKERKDIALIMLEKVSLLDRKTHFPNQLSGGQQQRVAIARALVNNPIVILADEPTGNLDSQTAKDILNILIELNKQGKTILLITHDVEISKNASRVILLKDGKII